MEDLKTTTSKYFENFTDREFTCNWNSVPHTFKPGEGKWCPTYLAEHFAKHLVDRELIRKGEMTNILPKRMEILEKCLREDDNKRIENKSVEELEIEILNKNIQAEMIAKKINKIDEKDTIFCKSCDSKGGRHKKDCPTLSSNGEEANTNKEEEFEGLK